MKHMFIITLAMTLLACGEANDLSNNENQDTEINKQIDVVATFEGLEELGPDYVYEGWIITDAGPVSVGRFDVKSNPTEFIFEGGSELTEGTRYVLTIEPKENDDPKPSSTSILEGDIVAEPGYSTTTNATLVAAFGDDFSTAAGSVFLQTPSTASLETDFNNGLWFFDPSGADPVPLTLPTLPTGWKYEGWAVTGEGPISTGTFLATDVADADGAGPTAGPDATPAFPGQDFIAPPIDLSTATAVISIEPDPDNSPSPFTFKPLVIQLDSPTAGTPIQMDTNLESFPTGAVKISIK